MQWKGVKTKKKHCFLEHFYFWVFSPLYWSCTYCAPFFVDRKKTVFFFQIKPVKFLPMSQSMKVRWNKKKNFGNSGETKFLFVDVKWKKKMFADDSRWKKFSLLMAVGVKKNFF